MRPKEGRIGSPKSSSGRDGASSQTVAFLPEAEIVPGQRKWGKCLYTCPMSGSSGGSALLRMRERVVSLLCDPFRCHQTPITSAGGRVSEVHPHKMKTGSKVMAKEKELCDCLSL